MDNSVNKSQEQINRELRRVNRRCEKMHEYSWATHLETLGEAGTISGTDAEVLLRNAVGVGMLFLEMRGHPRSMIALIYCISENDMAGIFRGIRRRVHACLKLEGETAI